MAEELHAAARALARRGRHEEAEQAYRRLVADVYTVEAQYHAWLDELAEVYRALGRPRELGHVLAHVRRFDEAVEAFTADGARYEAGRALDAWAATDFERAAALRTAAARRHEEAGYPVHAAIAWGRAGRPREAVAAWERAARDPRLAGPSYERALCLFNLGLAARASGDRDASHRHLIHAQQLLEEVADAFESGGERERAFDCWGVLLQLGREDESFENLAEGYVNCIRILKEDGLKFYALQYYEDFVRAARERGELHAAATVLREAADYARRMGLPYDRDYLRRCGAAWWEAGEKNERDGGPVELTENAWLAAADALNVVGDPGAVGDSYRRLAALDLPDARRARYLRVASRYPPRPGGAPDEPSFPDYLRRPHAYQRVWELDLVEWELDADHLAVCASIASDPEQRALDRRQALQVVLLELDARRARGAGERTPADLATIAAALGEVRAYAVLRPLERLHEHPHPAVRRAVMGALRGFQFKRIFRLLARGLADPAPEVRDGAVEALESLQFQLAFQPLTRIFQERSDHAVKVTALAAIGRIGTVEAGEFLVEVLRHGSEGLREVAKRLLAQLHNPDMHPILRRHLEQLEPGPARAALEEVVRGLQA